MNLNNKFFTPRSNSSNGQVDDHTMFHYRQMEEVIWATYKGGDIAFGTLSGFISLDKLTFTYQHHNHDKDFFSGIYHTTVKIDKGQYLLYEEWKWTCLDHSSGTSVLVECHAPLKSKII